MIKIEIDKVLFSIHVWELVQPKIVKFLYLDNQSSEECNKYPIGTIKYDILKEKI